MSVLGYSSYSPLLFISPPLPLPPPHLRELRHRKSEMLTGHELQHPYGMSSLPSPSPQFLVLLFPSSSGALRSFVYISLTSLSRCVFVSLSPCPAAVTCFRRVSPLPSPSFPALPLSPDCAYDLLTFEAGFSRFAPTRFLTRSSLLFPRFASPYSSIYLSTFYPLIPTLPSLHLPRPYSSFPLQARPHPPSLPLLRLYPLTHPTPQEATDLVLLSGLLVSHSCRSEFVYFYLFIHFTFLFCSNIHSLTLPLAVKFSHFSSSCSIPVDIIHLLISIL